MVVEKNGVFSIIKPLPRGDITLAMSQKLMRSLPYVSNQVYCILWCFNDQYVNLVRIMHSDANKMINSLIERWEATCFFSWKKDIPCLTSTQKVLGKWIKAYILSYSN